MIMEVKNWPQILEDIHKVILRHPEWLPSLDPPTRNAVNRTMDAIAATHWNMRESGIGMFDPKIIEKALAGTRAVNHERMLFAHASVKGGHEELTSGTELLMAKQICQLCEQVIHVGAFAYRKPLENNRPYCCVPCEQKRKIALERHNEKMAKNRKGDS